MSFEQDFIHGYEKHSDNFDSWCEKASTILGKITQCGIVETDKDGYALIAINRPDFGESYIDKKSYILDEHLTYSNNPIEGFKAQCSLEGIQFLHNNEESLYGKKFDLWYGFTYLEKIDKNTNRQYYFGSDNPEIYNTLFNNVTLVKNFIKYFKKGNEHIIDYFRDRRFNVAEKKEDSFVEDKIHLSERERLVRMLHTLGTLDKDENITVREWQCLQLYCQGKTAELTGEILNISRRTVETHFVNLKQKLKINSKAATSEVLR